MAIKDLMAACFKQGLDGQKIDLSVQAIAVNALEERVPVVAIGMDSMQSLAHMMKSANFPHLFIEGGVFYFNALFSTAENFPAVRIYFIKATLLDQVASIGMYLERCGLKLPIVDTKKFSQLIDDNNYSERYRSWFKKWTEKMKPFADLFDGRVKNTAIEKGVWLESGGCLVCGEETDYMSTVSLMGDTGFMLGFTLCKAHEDEARNGGTLLGYISKKWGVPLSFLANMRIVKHADEALLMSIEALSDVLECSIEKVEKNTITAIRPSGFCIIARQDALNNYAYNIQSPDGDLVSRIDSANHHSINYGPDHVHRNLSRRKKGKVESSFTYGFAVADIKAIKQLVEEAELRWKAR